VQRLRQTLLQRGRQSNRSQERPDPGDAIATYDLAWLWTELGVAELRT
jgi:hypothetical protein